MEKQDQVQMKKQNKKLVLDMIRRLEPISRMQLSKLTKMSPTTITRIVQSLEEENFVFEAKAEDTAIGRRPSLLYIKHNARVTIGIEIDKSYIKIGLLNFVNELSDFYRINRNPIDSYEDTLQTLVDNIRLIMKRNNITFEQLLGIGIGMPGRINYSEGVIISSEQLKWKEIHLLNDLKEYFNIPILIDNDLKMQSIAEFEATENSTHNGILIGVGSGIGASIVLNGEIYRGVNNNAGEISHMIVNPFGPQCSCGNHGCLTVYTSEEAFKSYIPKEELVDGQTTNEIIIQALQIKQTWTKPFVEHLSHYLAIVINNLICFYEPDYIIISGEFFEVPTELQTSLMKKCEPFINSLKNSNFKILFSNLNKYGVVKGAALQMQKQQLEEL